MRDPQEDEAVARRDEWVERLTGLVRRVEEWASGPGWSTRRIELVKEEPGPGRYRAPGLLLKKEAVRILLEPIARAAPGLDGVVDLYVMPAYDDLATLGYANGSWAVQHFETGVTPPAAGVAEGAELTSETLATMLESMFMHAALT